MESTVNFEVKGNEYKIKFPSVGDFRKIESLKQIFSDGMYTSLIGTATKGAQEAADMIDIEATLTVVCPDLLKDLKVEKIGDLGILDYKELKKAYQEQVAPWWNEILESLNEPNE